MGRQWKLRCGFVVVMVAVGLEKKICESERPWREGGREEGKGKEKDMEKWREITIGRRKEIQRRNCDLECEVQQNFVLVEPTLWGLHRWMYG